jgi:hypothetical protein
VYFSYKRRRKLFIVRYAQDESLIIGQGDLLCHFKLLLLSLLSFLKRKKIMLSDITILSMGRLWPLVSTFEPVRQFSRNLVCYAGGGIPMLYFLFS